LSESAEIQRKEIDSNYKIKGTVNSKDNSPFKFENIFLEQAYQNFGKSLKI
jgi:hypothetical protein